MNEILIDEVLILLGGLVSGFGLGVIVFAYILRPRETYP